MLISTSYGDKHKDELLARFRAALGLTELWQNPEWPLPNMEPAEERDFWGWRASYSFKAEAWVQDVTIAWKHARLLIYFLDQGQYIDGGFAVTVIYENTVAARARYFSWRACPHDFTSQSAGNCLHRYTCRHCHKTYDIDSSG